MIFNSAIKVRNVQEFIDRFNYDSLGLKSLRDYIMTHDSTMWNRLDRKTVIRTMVDPQAQIDTCLLEDFFREVINETNPKHLDYYQPNWYAIANGHFLVGDKKTLIKLYLKNEVYPGRASKWVVFNIESDRYTYKQTGDSSFFLDPMSYAIDFVNIDRIFESKNALKNMMPKDFQESPLNAFYFDIQKQNIKFKNLGKIKYFFDQIKGWSFAVEYINKPELYSGWLITELKKAE